MSEEVSAAGRRYADDVRRLSVDEIVRELVVIAENWVLDHDAGAGDVRRSFEERLEQLGIVRLRHAPACRRAEGAVACLSCCWELPEISSGGVRGVASMPIDVEVVRAAWDRFEAGCSGLLASKCSHHRPYMGCPLDCGDVENAIGEEWKILRPFVGPLLDEVVVLRRSLDALVRAVIAERDCLRSLLAEACGELDDTGGEFARRRSDEISAAAELVAERASAAEAHAAAGANAVAAERDRLRAWLRRACNELDAAGTEGAKQWASAIRAEAGIDAPLKENA